MRKKKSNTALVGSTKLDQPGGGRCLRLHRRGNTLKAVLQARDEAAAAAAAAATGQQRAA